ncbi:hypothetical protein [Sphingorhabdus sp. Alg231-15]
MTEQPAHDSFTDIPAAEELARPRARSEGDGCRQPAPEVQQEPSPTYLS